MRSERTVGCRNVVQTISQDTRKEVSHCLLSRMWLFKTFPGSSGDVIVGHFAMTYHDEAAALGIDLEELYSAMLADAQNTPPNWDIQGRQAAVYKCVFERVMRAKIEYHVDSQYGYVPFSALDTSSVGRHTREGSRTLEVSRGFVLMTPSNVIVQYAFEDFAIRQVALVRHNLCLL